MFLEDNDSLRNACVFLEDEVEKPEMANGKSAKKIKRVMMTVLLLLWWWPGSVVETQPLLSLALCHFDVLARPKDLLEHVRDSARAK